MNTSNSATAQPLVISTDEYFIAQAANWCAAVGATMSRQSGAEGLRRAWREANLVLIDADCITEILPESLPRREHVFLLGESNRDNLEHALRLGAEQILDADDARVVGVLANTLEEPGEACFITVMGACGGVGASTVATAIACAAAGLGKSSALVDADPAAGGLELILGAEREPGLRWPDLQAATGHIGLAELRAVLPSKHGVDVVSFDRAGVQQTVAEPIVDTLVRGYEVVVADVPRHLDDLGRVLLSRSIATVLIVPMRLGGLVAAEHLIPRLQQLSSHVLVVGQPVRGGCSEQLLARRLAVPVVAQWLRQQRVFVDVEHGLGPIRGLAKKTALHVLETVGQK